MSGGSPFDRLRYMDVPEGNISHFEVVVIVVDSPLSFASKGPSTCVIPFLGIAARQEHHVTRVCSRIPYPSRFAGLRTVRAALHEIVL